MDHWLLEERDRLLRVGVRATVKAVLISVGLVFALGVALFMLADTLDSRDRFSNLLLMSVLVLGPPLLFFLIDRLRAHLWAKAMDPHVRRLRANQFLGNYMDKVGDDALMRLPEMDRDRVARLLRRERQGYLPRERDYALAVQSVLPLEPGTRAGRRVRQRRAHD